MVIQSVQVVWEIVMTEQKEFYKVKDGIKIYYIDNRLIGDDFAMKRYLTSHLGISFTKAKKHLLKIKEWKDKDALSI